MHVESRPIRRFALLLAALPFLGCENVPPFLDRGYVRVGTQMLEERLAVDDDANNGPFPGVGISAGTLLDVERTTANALEAEFQYYDLRDKGDIDGYGFRYTAGWRRFWNMDGRWRPSMGTGGEWTDFHMEDHDRDSDPHGPGGYFDLGLDWMMTPIYAVGVRLRGHLRYEEADHNQGLKAGVDLALQMGWRF